MFYQWREESPVGSTPEVVRTHGYCRPTHKNSSVLSSRRARASRVPSPLHLGGSRRDACTSTLSGMRNTLRVNRPHRIADMSDRSASRAANCHVEGMLDRDQRTAKSPASDYRNSDSVTVYHYCIHGDARKYKRFSLARTACCKSEYLRNILTRLKQVLIVGIYFLSVINLPCSLSAPAKLLNMDERLQLHPKWINPCGMDAENGAVHDTNTQIPRVSDQVLLTQIVSQARTALSKANQFKEDYALKVFNTNFEELHKNWKDTRYDWLPNEEQIPKSLNENLPEEHLKSLKLDETLLNTYQYLQMIAVGLEQVVWDQEDDDGPFLQNFNQSEYNLRLVLCEIQMAIYECSLQIKPDVSRDSMPAYLRVTKDNTSTNLRDWIIYRDYMNVLEYVVQVFEYLKSNV